ncbi:FAD-binding oxidoreductase [Aureimonas fodinaquatilis]|uniref:FAD-binding oxidoreductase n=1 Tax=Aureimonas fodinaquatilis TaxID=2565783 RepID=A0A5B0E2T6_9HYPH|nr:FAD-binding oxidoreductase [Aureimonas fodinaquatilis]KAA0972261.1 FAD-binding oxidoreductase [Aureimonas fodinaquatilis]
MDTLVDRQKILSERLGQAATITDPVDMERYCRDWHGDVATGAVAVLRPASAQEVSEAVRLCAELQLAIVPQGGNTGLALGGIPDNPSGQVVLSLERMNSIRAIMPDDFSAVVEAGCVLEAIKNEVEAAGCYFPLALGAQGSCQIGGNVSTNAGGINVLRYGMTRELVLGLEVVLADGTIWSGLSTLRKDNRGVDLKQLFIGAEGTMGIITAVAIKLLPQPEQIETAMLALPSVEAAMALYRRARRDCCDLMSAFELMRPEAFSFARMAYPDLPMPLSTEYPAYVLMELTGGGLVDVKALMEGFLTREMESGEVLDGVFAASRQQALNLWKVREGMNEGQAMYGPHLRTDLSVPLSQVAAYIEEASNAVARLMPDCLVAAYGHVGDGNIHFNILPPRGASPDEVAGRIKQGKTLLFDILDRFNGSISAEHGVGRLKRDDFEKRLPEAQKLMLHALKNALDPQGRLNPNCQISRSEHEISH